MKKQISDFEKWQKERTTISVDFKRKIREIEKKQDEFNSMIKELEKQTKEYEEENGITDGE